MTKWEYADGIDQQLLLSYDELSIGDPSRIQIAAANHSTDMFLDPGYFPLQLDDDKINVKLLYGEDEAEMTVQLAPDSYKPQNYSGLWCREASMETVEMDEYQRTIAFLYLVGKVLDDRKT